MDEEASDSSFELIDDDNESFEFVGDEPVETVVEPPPVEPPQETDEAMEDEENPSDGLRHILDEEIEAFERSRLMKRRQDPQPEPQPDPESPRKTRPTQRVLLPPLPQSSVHTFHQVHDADLHRRLMALSGAGPA